MDESFVIVSVISGIFGILGLELLTHNWFRKERFKFETQSLKKRQDLELKKLARDMGIGTPSLPRQAAGDNVGSLLEIAKGLQPDQLGAIADIIQGQVGSGEGMPEGLDGLLEFAMKNPDLVKGFLGGVNKGGSAGGRDEYL